MAKEKTESAKLMDELQTVLRPAFKQWGFRGRDRAFNRTTDAGLTEVIQFQMGRFDPPGTPSIPFFRENLYGKFTVNLGIYVPEVAKYHGFEAGSFVHESHCCVRARLGQVGPEGVDIWWDLTAGALPSSDLQRRLERDALPFLARYGTREAIIKELLPEKENPYVLPRRIVCAIILAHQGRHDESRRLLVVDASESRYPEQHEYIYRLAERLGLGRIDA